MENIAPKFAKPKDQKRPRSRKNHSRRNKTRSKAKMIRELDALARQDVFDRDGSRCIAAGVAGIRCAEGIQWAHVLSRRHLCLRWEADNAMSLCAGHHLWWHHEPAMAVDWFMSNFRDRWERIKAVLLLKPKVDVKSLHAERCAGSQQ